MIDKHLGCFNLSVMRFSPATEALIRISLKEDIGSGDVTSSLAVPAGQRASAFIYAKDSGVLAGIDVVGRVLKTIDKRIRFKRLFQDGQSIDKGDRVGKIEGRAASILTAERTALNFLQRLSGVATLTSQFVQKVSGTGVKIYDTRKTAPGWRELEKYAVRMGRGHNHRRGLYDQILIKDNHIKAAGSLVLALKRAKAARPKKLLIEAEVSNNRELKVALEGGADWVMLDNFSIPRLKRAIHTVRVFSKMNNKRVRLEVSGQVNLQNVRRIAKRGPDLISVGKITHSAPALDFSLEIERVW